MKLRMNGDADSSNSDGDMSDTIMYFAGNDFDCCGEAVFSAFIESPLNGLGASRLFICRP